MTSLRIVVAGSPRAAVPTLSALAETRHEVVRVITRPDSAQGRKRVLTPTPVADAAGSLGIPVLRATRISELEPELLPLDVDLGVIVAYGGLVREPILSWPRLGWINLHFSLLPRWRGAAPVQHALIAGDELAGLTVFRLTAGLDEGDWYAQQSSAIGPTETAGELLERLSHEGAALVSSVVDDLARGTATATPQAGTATLAPKLTRNDARIQWARPASQVHGRIRGVTPEPGAFCMLPDSSVLKVLEAVVTDEGPTLQPGHCAFDGDRVWVGTATTSLELRRVQPAGRSAMPASDWARGLIALPVIS
jgi:methionyl-tRNA formyltransferase